MPGQRSDIPPEIAPFLTIGPMRTWSVIVTIMGDLLRAPDAAISGRGLAALTGPMGISDQAIRVAIHRLKKDGWVESRKEGRESLHVLTDRARLETEAAHKLVYDPAPAMVEAMSLVVAPGDLGSLAEHLPPGSVALGARAAVVPKAGTGLSDRLLVAPIAQGHPLPDWVRQELLPDGLRTELDRLAQLVAGVGMPDTALGRLVLRLVILHNWRRLALRLSPVAEALLPDMTARMIVTKALRDLPAPGPAALAKILES